MRATCETCGHVQPPDWQPGDFCGNCGGVARREKRCHWCVKLTPAGKFCRNCGAHFVRTAELPLALLLRRDGLAKDEIPRRLTEATAEEKEQLWGRVRRARI